ncbi:response regulator [Roseovarius sp. SK2]|jgi:CheY-like chemotaxis protein|uniref:response regulator n=1 Tax=Roseovarius TaxID=74030 RepID=UPI001FE41C18|nr:MULTISPECIES: response regulator [Roseovarius]MDD9727997.1 response regulator [Roseovarius sp. SK2]
MAHVVTFPNAPKSETGVMRQPLQTILHVDDDDDIRVIIKMALEIVGSFDVHQFATGQDAVEAAAGVNPQMLLLDVMMPDMSGEDVWHAITATPGLADIPTVFLTAKAEDSFSKQLREKGAVAVITKPVDPMMLGTQIEQIWQSIDHV